MTTPTQADRDAAAALWAAEGTGPSMDGAWPQAFANHREQTARVTRPYMAAASCKAASTSPSRIYTTARAALETSHENR